MEHNKLIEGASCPECGRRYCLDSIENSIQVGSFDCPYCDTPYEWFSEIPISLKKIIRGKTVTTTEKITKVEIEHSKHFETFEPRQRLDKPRSRLAVSYADRIRQFALEKYVNPARRLGKKEVSFCARDIHNGLGFTSRYPNVIQAIEGQKFRKMVEIKTIEKIAPPTAGSGLSSTICWNITLE